MWGAAGTRAQPSPVTLGDRARDKGDWDTAAEHYRQALKRNPDNPPIWVQYGHALKERGGRIEAEAAYRRAIEGDPASADAHLQLAHVLKLQGRREEAKAAYLRAAALDPALADARRELAALGLRDGEIAAAREALPTLPPRRRRPSRITRADRARELGQWAEAARLYRQALSRNPRNAAIWVQYGHMLRQLDDLSGAETAYRRALAGDRQSADGHLQLGHALKLQGKTEEAQAAYLRAFVLDPRQADALSGLFDSGRIFRKRAVMAELHAALVPAPEALSAKLPPGVEPSESELLAAHGITADILGIFDHLFYFYANPAVAADLTKPARRPCLVHFCRIGISKLLPCNENFAFDAAFYVETYLENRPLPAEFAYRHWLNEGLRLGRHPNRHAWVKSILGVNESALASVDLTFLDTCKRLDAKEKWTDAFLRFIDQGVIETQIHLPITDSDADFFLAIANRLSLLGRNQEALKVVDQILFSNPTHRVAIKHRADCLLQAGDLLIPASLHVELIESGEGNEWSYLHAADCFAKLGDFDRSLQFIHQGVVAYPGDVYLQCSFERIAGQFLSHEWQRAFALGALGRADEGQRRLRDACRAVTSLVTQEPALSHRPIRSVAVVAYNGLAQCRFYRVEQKIEHLKGAGYRVFAYDESEIDQFLSQLYKFEAAIFYRVPAWPAIIFAILKAKSLGIATFYEIDDLIFSEHEYPDDLETFGGLIGLDLWLGLKLGVPLFRHAMSLCDFGIASTPALAAKMAEVVPSGKIFVHRNAFGPLHEQAASTPRTSRDEGRVSIFYGSGTKSHKEDFQELVEPALVEMVRRYGDRITIVLVGYHALTDRLKSIRKNLTLLEPVWEVEKYWALLRAADINIAVLKESAMADCKSEIKWMEAAMMGVPSVVSATATYREVIEPGVTGLLCNTPEDWITALDLLVTNPDLRRDMGAEAQRRVRERYNMLTMAANIAQILTQAVPPVSPAPLKPTVLIVNVYYPPQAIGGATRVVHDNVRHLATQYSDDFRVEVFTTTTRGERDYELSCYVQDGVRVTAVGGPVVPTLEPMVVDDGMHRVFGEFLDELRPALIHFHCIQRLTASVVAAAHERGIPYLITAHDGWWISDVQFLVDDNDRVALYDFVDVKSSNVSNPRIPPLRSALLQARQVLTVSDKFADLYRQCGVRNVASVPNGVSALPNSTRTPSVDGRVRLGFLGGIGRAKGYQLIKYALLSRRLTHLHLTVIDGALAPHERRCEVWGATEVQFLPKFPERRVADLYAMLDVVLAPSVCIESFGLVAREALQCGCWVIASDRGSIGECVSEGINGFVVDVSDAEDLVRVLGLIDANPERYLSSPPAPPVFRTATEQSDELAGLYASLLSSWTPPALMQNLSYAQQSADQEKSKFHEADLTT